MMESEAASGLFVVLIKKTDDKRAQYETAKKLREVFPDTPFSELREKLAEGDPIVVLKTYDRASADECKLGFAGLGANVDIVEQRNVGSAKVF
jgi:hypothetical protein